MSAPYPVDVEALTDRIRTVMLRDAVDLGRLPQELPRDYRRRAHQLVMNHVGRMLLIARDISAPARARGAKWAAEHSDEGGTP